MYKEPQSKIEEEAEEEHVDLWGDVTSQKQSAFDKSVKGFEGLAGWNGLSRLCFAATM